MAVLGRPALETAARYPDFPAGIVVMDTHIAPPVPLVEGLRQFAGALRTPMYREAVLQFLNQFIGFGVSYYSPNVRIVRTVAYFLENDYTSNR